MLCVLACAPLGARACLCVCTRACLLACLLQDALDNVWKAHQTLGGEPYPQARMQHLLIVFGTLLVRFMQVGWSGVGGVGRLVCRRVNE